MQMLSLKAITRKKTFLALARNKLGGPLGRMESQCFEKPRLEIEWR